MRMRVGVRMALIREGCKVYAPYMLPMPKPPGLCGRRCRVQMLGGVVSGPAPALMADVA